MILLIAICSGACTLGRSPADPSGSDGFITDEFRLIGEEAVGLNGAENDQRPPIVFLLLGDARTASSTEEALVERYVQFLEAAGWTVTPWSDPGDWWSYGALRGTSTFVRVGPASRFGELAGIEEGYSRTVFRELRATDSSPMVVVSIDPAR